MKETFQMRILGAIDFFKEKGLLLFLLMAVIALTQDSHAYSICGDNICGNAESSFSCPRDCPKAGGDRYCEAERDGLCDVDCYGDDPDCGNYEQGLVTARTQNTRASSGSFLLKGALFLASLLVVAGIVFFVLKKVKEGRRPPPTSYLGMQQPGQNYYANQNPETRYWR